MPASPTFDAKALRERFNPDGSPLRRMQMCMLEMVSELDRVCRRGGLLIIPTYMNRTEKSEAGTFVSAVGKAGADFKRQFPPDSYRAFFLQNGYSDVTITLAEGRIPCAVAVMTAKGT